eukprot:1157996-Pelagomonas_calceolata.AAC.6
MQAFKAVNRCWQANKRNMKADRKERIEKYGGKMLQPPLKSSGPYSAEAANMAHDLTRYNALWSAITRVQETSYRDLAAL